MSVKTEFIHSSNILGKKKTFFCIQMQPINVQLHFQITLNNLPGALLNAQFIKRVSVLCATTKVHNKRCHTQMICRVSF